MNMFRSTRRYTKIVLIEIGHIGPICPAVTFEGHAVL
jgi:hypothetical protein